MGKLNANFIFFSFNKGPNKALFVPCPLEKIPRNKENVKNAIY